MKNKKESDKVVVPNPHQYRDGDLDNGPDDRAIHKVPDEDDFDKMIKRTPPKVKEDIWL